MSDEVLEEVREYVIQRRDKDGNWTNVKCRQMTERQEAIDFANELRIYGYGAAMRVLSVRMVKTIEKVWEGDRTLEMMANMPMGDWKRRS